MNTKINFLLLCIGCILIMSCSTKPPVGADQLLALDSQKLGSDNMKILMKETKFKNNFSTIEEKVYKRGSAAGSSVFAMCSFTIFAKKRGYSHFVILDRSDLGCNDCEWASKISIGYLNDVKPSYTYDIRKSPKPQDEKRKVEVRRYLSDQFPQYELSLRSDKLEIYSVKSLMLVCKKHENICSW